MGEYFQKCLFPRRENASLVGTGRQNQEKRCFQFNPHYYEHSQKDKREKKTPNGKRAAAGGITGATLAASVSGEHFWVRSVKHPPIHRKLCYCTLGVTQAYKTVY